MGIGTRSKSHQGECLGQEQSSRVTVDGATNEKGTPKGGVASGNNDTSNQTNNSTNNPGLSVNSNLNESVGPGALGSTSTNSSTTSTVGGGNTSMTLVTRTRGVKRPKREPSPPGSPAKKVAAKEVKTATPEAKKRQWELWTVDEKSTFFQALNECGRDFFAIQNNFAQKYKKNGHPAIMIKNKEQVRHFYYRTWSKIAKYIEMKDGIKKHALEVYGLIHYGEMRKRLGGLRADKNLHKLNEFIQEGSTLIKIRRKSFRIRTPYCNALKKINNVEDPVDDDDSACRVPERVTLELNPKNNSAWLHVQEMAQNPRLRMTLKSDQHLSTVMSYLQKKWKPPRLKLKESLNSFDEIQKQLVLYPHRSSKCYPVTLQAIETQPKPDLKLNNYHANIQAYREKMQSVSGNNENSSDAVLGEPLKLTEGVKDEDCAANSAIKEQEPLSSSLTVTRSDFADISSDNAMFPDDLINLPSSIADKSLTTSSLLSSTTGNEPSVPCNTSDPSTEIRLPSTTANAPATISTAASSVNTNAASIANSTQLSADAANVEALEKLKNKFFEQSKKGWTLEEAAELTVAELFLIFGKEGLIRLEYDWSKTSNPDSKEDDIYDRYTIINRLRRLVHLATMEFTDIVKVKAPKANEKPKSGKSGCEVCEACGKSLNQSDSNSKGNSKLVNKNMNKNSSSCPQNNSGKNESCSNNPENSTKCQPVKREMKVEKKVDDSVRVDGVFRVPVIPGRGPLSQTLVANEYINQFNRPRHRRKLQRSARKPVILQRTLLPKENPAQMMTLTLLPTATPVNPVEAASFLSVNNRTNAVITTRTLSSFSNTYTTQVLTQPIASTLSVHNQNNPIIVQRALPPQQTPLGIAVTTTTTNATNTSIAETAVTNSINSVKSAAVVLPSSQIPKSSSPSLTVLSNPPLSLKLTPIVTNSSSQNVPSSSSNVSEENTSDTSDMIPLLNVNANSSSDAAGTPPLAPTTPKTPSSSSSSPPNMSSLFDISLSDVPMQILEGGSDSKGPLSSSTESGLVTPLHSPLHSECRLQSPYSSPFKFNADNAWMLGEMADISLGSFLGDSPIKKSSSSDSLHGNVTSTNSLTLNSLFSDWSRDSTTSRMDLDTTLQMMMSENSMDYVSKFAELAEKVAASDATSGNDNPATAAAATPTRIAKNAQRSTVHDTNTNDGITQLNDDDENFH